MNQNLWRRLTGMKTKFRFYPHCIACSQKQGAILSSATRKATGRFWKATNFAGAGGGRLAYNHGLQFRLNHMAGSVVAAATVVGASDNEINRGNVKRFEKLQHAIVGEVLMGKTRNMYF